MPNLYHPVLLFDGECNLCNRFVQKVIRMDPTALFRFASLQSEAGKRLTSKAKVSGPLPDSVVLVDAEGTYFFSEAALRVYWHLGRFRPLLGIAFLIPRGIRDAVYRVIAKNRYKWFGRRDSCMVPTPELKDRFLES